MPTIPELIERGFPLRIKRAVNALIRRTNALDNFTGIDPIIVDRAEGNIRVRLTEKAQTALKQLADETGEQDASVAGQPTTTGGNAIVTAEYWDASDSSVKTANFVVQL